MYNVVIEVVNERMKQFVNNAFIFEINLFRNSK